MACEGRGSNVRSSYYSVLGIRKDASVSDIRTAYRKLAMVLLDPDTHSLSLLGILVFWSILFFSLTQFLLKKWHPDRYAKNPGVAGEAERRFQQIQEAYSGRIIFLTSVILVVIFFSRNYM